MSEKKEKRFRKYCFTLISLSLFLLCSCTLFSAKEIKVAKASASASLDYYNLSVGKADELSFETKNFLRSNLLMDLYESAPERLVPILEELYGKEKSRVTLWVLAEVCFNIALREKKESVAVRYYLSSAFYSYSLLFSQKYGYSEKYDPFIYLAARNYNTAVGAICSYLNKMGLLTSNSYYLNLADGKQVIFRTPEFKLPLPLSDYKTFQLCSDYIPKNLSHFTHDFGLGVPLIAETKRLSSYQSLRQEVPLVHGATAFLRFYVTPDKTQGAAEKKEDGTINARIEIYDTESVRSIQAGEDRRVPLIFDYSTPFAYYVSTFPDLNLLYYMLNPDRMESNMGLYTLEPYHPDKIPVIMVHGLMSSPHTWMQMINSLKNNPEIREKYQFWYFTYSSGNPILYSAARLRKSIQSARNELATTPERKAAFDKMVILGHSMGGLISKTTIMEPGDSILKKLTELQWEDIEKKCTEDQKKMLKDFLIFQSVPSVKRIVFLAVPHRGSPMAKYSIANLGSFLITLPSGLVSDVHGLIKNLFGEHRELNEFLQMKTGIDSLETDNTTLMALSEVPFKQGIPYHSIIGNQKEANVPGGSDGIVAYGSSHLDGAASELIVKSGHSVQIHPVAIQEVKRILLEHLKESAGR